MKLLSKSVKKYSDDGSFKEYINPMFFINLKYML